MRPLSLHGPWQALGKPTSHDPFEIIPGDERHLLDKQGDRLPIRAFPSAQHRRQIRSPERAAWAEYLDQPLHITVDVAVRIESRRTCRHQWALDEHVRIFRERY